jgi:nicotinamidase-related amidase
MQISFLEALSMKELKKITEAQKSVLVYCKEKNIPVIVIEYAGETPTIPELLPPDLNFLSITKSHNDAFKGTPLAWLLRKLGATTVFLMGIFAGNCVLETAQSSRRKGFAVQTSLDVCDHIPRYRTWYHKNGRVAGTAEEAIKQFLTPP